MPDPELESLIAGPFPPKVRSSCDRSCRSIGTVSGSRVRESWRSIQRTAPRNPWKLSL